MRICKAKPDYLASHFEKVGWPPSLGRVTASFVLSAYLMCVCVREIYNMSRFGTRAFCYLQSCYRLDHQSQWVTGDLRPVT